MKANYFDVVVIGAGFYGSLISIFLNKYKKINKILLLEKEAEIMNRSSSRNQARIHNGYHYPRSFMTANRSHQNFSVLFPTGSLLLKRILLVFMQLLEIIQKYHQANLKSFAIK